MASVSASLAIDAAREAYKLDPKPIPCGNGLPFDFLNKARLRNRPALLGEFSSSVLSASEQKRADEIAVLAKLQSTPPEIPAPHRALSIPESQIQSSMWLPVACRITPTGYTSRTQELLIALKSSGVGVTTLTRPGYPWDRSDRYALPLENSTTFEGITYCIARRRR